MVHLNQKGVNILALVPCWLEVLLSFYKTGTNAKILKSNVIGMSTWTYLSLDFFFKECLLLYIACISAQASAQFCYSYKVSTHLQIGLLAAHTAVPGYLMVVGEKTASSRNFLNCSREPWPETF